MIIAEISQNFTCLAEAKQLVRLARENGADLAKAQLFDSLKLYGKKVPAELSFGDAKELFDYGANIGIEVFFSVFDVERVKWCEEIGVKRYKIACRMRDRTVLDAIGSTGKKFFISSSLGQEDTLINSGIDLFRKGRILYCMPQYPCTLSNFDMTEITRIQGFSDHIIGLDAAKIALARGAQIIEKHFAVDHQTGIDAEWSMTPSELCELRRWETIVKQVL